MLRTIIVIILAGFALSACASSLARPSLTAYGGAPASAKNVQVAKAKHKAVKKSAPKATQPAATTTEAKPKKNKTWRWYAPWREKK